MKIFNWVHRRFTHKDGFSQSVKKADRDDIFTKDGDTQVLLDNVVHLADFLDGWQGVVLTIGTFGLGSLTEDALKQENDDHEYYCKEEETLFEVDDDVYNEEGEELNPLVVVNMVEEGSKCDPAAGAVVYRGSIVNNSTPVDGRRDDNDIAVGDHSDEYTNNWDRHYNNMMKKKKKERITLADLFSAELGDGNSVSSKNRKLMQPAGGVLMSKKKLMQTDAAKHVFPKKLIPATAGVKDYSRPLKKLNQLMKKMLKRKIHPDAEANYEEDYQSSSTSGIIPSDELCNNEWVSLLQNSRDEM